MFGDFVEPIGGFGLLDGLTAVADLVEDLHAASLTTLARIHPCPRHDGAATQERARARIPRVGKHEADFPSKNPERAVERGLRPLLMGRSADKLAPLAKRFGLEYRAVSLDDGPGLRDALKGHAAVLHAAGPYAQTAAPMLQACFDVGASYLDITGEPDVFRDIYARDAEAKAKGLPIPARATNHEQIRNGVPGEGQRYFDINAGE